MDRKMEVKEIKLSDGRTLLYYTFTQNELEKEE